MGKKLKFRFERREKKYLLTKEQFESLRKMLDGLLIYDDFGKETTVQSIYYDTDTDLLIRRSLLKPVYKEKLRLRRYGSGEEGKDLFLELKKKYKGIVYKRRMTVPFDTDAQRVLYGVSSETQIGKEISFFRDHYDNLSPKMMILCEREAFLLEGTNIRITFDKNLRYRTTDIDFSKDTSGKALTDPGCVVMEIKAACAIPLSLSKMLSALGIFQQQFSKYGAAYMLEQKKNGPGRFDCRETSLLNQPEYIPAMAS